MGHRTIKKYLQGSATIEASLILPFILLIFVLLIQVCFFLHNECVAWQYGYIAALRADTVTGKESVKEGLARQYGIKLIQEGMLAAYGQEIEATRQGQTLTVQIRGAVETKDSGNLVPPAWHLEAKGEVNLLRPVAFIRRAEIAKELFTGDT